MRDSKAVIKFAMTNYCVKIGKRGKQNLGNMLKKYRGVQEMEVNVSKELVKPMKRRNDRKL